VASRADVDQCLAPHLRSVIANATTIPLLGMREAVQRAERRLAESDAISERCYSPGVLCRLRYKLSLRDLTKMFQVRGFV
jgi:hypothetical protein